MKPLVCGWCNGGPPILAIANELDRVGSEFRAGPGAYPRADCIGFGYWDTWPGLESIRWGCGHAERPEKGGGIPCEGG